MQIYSKTFFSPRSHLNLLRGPFPMLRHDVRLVSDGSWASRPVRFMPPLVLPFPTDAFSLQVVTSLPTPSSLPSAAALASDVIPPLWSGAAIFFFHLQIGSIFEVVTLPLALVVHLSLLVCVCVWGRMAEMDQGDCSACVSVRPQRNVLLTQADMQIRWIFQTITGFWAPTATLCCMCVLANMSMWELEHVFLTKRDIFWLVRVRYIVVGVWVRLYKKMENRWKSI